MCRAHRGPRPMKRAPMDVSDDSCEPRVASRCNTPAALRLIGRPTSAGCFIKSLVQLPPDSRAHKSGPEGFESLVKGERSTGKVCLFCQSPGRGFG